MNATALSRLAALALVSLSAVAAPAVARQVIKDPVCYGRGQVLIYQSPGSTVNDIAHVDPPSAQNGFRGRWIHIPISSAFTPAPNPATVDELINGVANPLYQPPCPDKFSSAVWFTLSNDELVNTVQYTQALPQNGYPMGSRLGLNLAASPSPGDFLPVGDTLAESSLCLLPTGGGGLSTGWQGVTRPTLDGAVDLVTGLPLAQVTDLELPIDGAVFRLTRTRSGNHPRQMGGVLSQSFGGPDRWWDWVGEGWMASENPILLIDAAMPDVTGPGAAENDEDPRTTWLWLDAHHSIPFQQVMQSGGAPQYEAPPRFRARMTHNGTWQGGQWSERPTQFDVWLYEAQVHYTFVAINEDVPPNYWANAQGQYAWSSYHERPIPARGHTEFHDPANRGINPGLGIPHYGLCVRVEDQNGHSAEIAYCDVRRLSVDDLDTEAGIECVQDGLAKGEIKYIRLKSGGETRWTLVYAHRRYLGLNGVESMSYLLDDYPDETRPELWEQYGYSAIERIYAFRGDVAQAALDEAPLTIHNRNAPNLEWGADSSDPLWIHNQTATVPLPTTWEHQVRYHYDAPKQKLPGVGQDPLKAYSSPPVLLKTTVRSRAPGATGIPAEPAEHESVKTTVFVYTFPWSGIGEQHTAPPNPLEPHGASVRTTPWLRMIFHDDDLGRLMAAAKTLELEECLTVDTLAQLGSSADEGLSAHESKLFPFASIRWEPHQATEWSLGSPSNLAPPFNSLLVKPDGMRHYFSLDASETWNDSQPGCTPSIVVVGSAVSGQRYYRFHHLVVPQDATFGGSGSPVFCESTEGETGRVPSRSIFAHPFRWWADLDMTMGHSGLLATPDLSKCRWISLIDEFPTEARETGSSSNADYDEPSENYAVDTGLKKAQLSRRVVEMNAAGFVLRDFRWQFGSTGNGIASVVMSGGGLGEECVYDKIENHFADRPSLLNGTTPQFRREPVLVEHRSVGWSAAFMADSGGSQGLINFIRYDLLADSGSPSGHRLEPLSVGIQKGADPQGNKWVEGRKFTTYDHPANSNTSRETTYQLQFPCPVTVSQADSLTPPSSPSAAAIADLHGSSYFHSTATVTIVVRTLDADPNWPDQPELERRVLQRSIIGAPRQLRPDPASSWYFPVEKEWYDDHGNVTWSASGLVKDPINPSAAPDDQSSLIFTYYDRYPSDYQSNALARNQTHYTIVDTVPGADVTVHDSTTELTIPTPGPETGWVRQAAVDPKNVATTFNYDWFGLSDVYFPNGRRWAKRVLTFPKGMLVPEVYPNSEYLEGLPRYLAREYILNDLVKEEPSGKFHTESAGEVIDHSSTRPDSPLIKRRVEFTNSFTLGFLNVDDNGNNNGSTEVAPLFTPMAAAKMGFDSSGRMRQADLLEYIPATQGWYTIGSKWINNLGEVYRERDLDGTITRITRNSLGQNLRRYVGTEDQAWVQGASSSLPYNMALLERTEYGADFTNAWMPTTVRRYSKNPTWDRDYYSSPAAGDDQESVATKTSYDWRMRAVRQDSFQRGDPDTAVRESTTLTYYDHMNRPRFTATFGCGNLSWLTGTLNPEALHLQSTPAEALPSAIAFFPSSSLDHIAPLSLTEMLYASDGSMSEQRTYDVAWNTSLGSNPPYHAEFHYRGQAGQEVFTQRPGEGVHISKLDGLGRVASSALVAPGQSSGNDPYAYELSRTDYLYDGDGNAVDVASWERVIVDSTDALSTSNAVRTRTVSWFDQNKRLIASADLGTEQGASGFVAGSAQFVRLPSSGSPPAAPDFHHTTGAVTCPSTLPVDAPLHMYAFDKRGNQTHAAEARGSGAAIVTVSTYSNMGRLVSKVENAADSDTSKQRSTEYAYSIGRIASIIAHRTASGTEKEVTSVDYGADVVDADFVVKSHSNALIGTMKMPDPSTGLASTSPFFTLKYNFQGHIAERVDARGVVFRYSYDDQERLSKVTVGRYSGSGGAFQDQYPGDMTSTPPGTPTDRIGRVEYGYDDNGRLRDIKTFGEQGSTAVLTANRYEYNQRGSLIKDWQSYGAAVGSGTPVTVYGWQFSGSETAGGGGGAYALGYSRLATMTYPVQNNQTARVIGLNYGQSGSIEEKLSRLTGLITNMAPSGQPTDLAQFGLSGSGRRVSLGLGGGKVLQSQRLGTEIGYAALDSYGRLLDMHAKNAGGTTLFRSQYTYDVAGNRVSAKLTQAPTSSTQDNVRSQHNDYDHLDRLIGTQVGSLDSSGVITSTSLVQSDSWNLDLLGNWSGIPGMSGPLGRVTTTPSGTTSFGYDADQRNRMTTLKTGTTSTPVQYDAAGNLQFDGTYYYQYDAWNRLIQVNQGVWTTEGTVQIGSLVKNWCFDGLGRLARTLSPYPNPGAAGGVNRTERFYYDGIRRIQEVVTDPIASQALAEGSESPPLQQMAEETTPQGSDPQGTTVGFEQGQVAAAASIITPPPLPTGQWLDREYVWGPGDGPGGVDELLVQYDYNRKPWWVIQDEGGDVATLCEIVGGAGGDSRVVAQFTYDAYGSPLSFDSLYAHPLMHCGHKGLFVDRLDLGVVGAGNAESIRIQPGAQLLCHNRNRMYSPKLGRFLQQDPNASGAIVIEDPLCSGSSPASRHLPDFDPAASYRNGAGLYEYLGSCPQLRHDALGLQWEGVFGEFLSFGVTLGLGALRGGVDGITSQYADNLDADLDWALDWAMGDGWHTRSENSWIVEAWREGMQRGVNAAYELAGGNDSPFEFIFQRDPLHAGLEEGTLIVRAGRVALKVWRGMRDINKLKIFATYDLAVEARRLANWIGQQSHHLVERQMSKVLKAQGVVLNGDGPAVNVATRFHLSDIRKAFNTAYKNAGVWGDMSKLTLPKARQIIEEVYHANPAARNECLKWLGFKV